MDLQALYVLGTLIDEQISKEPLPVPLCNALHILGAIVSQEPDAVFEATFSPTGHKVLVTKYDFDLINQHKTPGMPIHFFRHAFLDMDGEEVYASLNQLDILLTKELMDKATNASLERMRDMAKQLKEDAEKAG